MAHDSSLRNSGVTVLYVLFLVCFCSISSANNQSVSQQLLPGQTPEGLSQIEWDSVQQQMKRYEYSAVKSEEGGFTSKNIAHRWQIKYADDGRTTLAPFQSDKDKYFISLQLKSLGYADQIEFDQPQEIVPDKTTLTYYWNENVSEIWTNSDEQLEQWFEIQKKPAIDSHGQYLTLQMSLDTNLDVALIGNSLSFAHQISYSKLKVWDSTGAEMPARMQFENSLLSLLVDDSLAIYPLTVDPSFQQQAYIKASNTDAGDIFGRSISMSGNTLVVGSGRESSDSVGVDGDQSNNNSTQSGAVYVFTHDAGVWTQQAYLKSSNLDSRGHNFGHSVAISGDTIVVGAHREGSNATGVNGDQNNILSPSSGAAYVFTRTAGVWSEQAYLKASNTGTQDVFGRSVAISGDTVVVAAVSEDSNATGINGDQNNNSANFAGAVYVFTRTLGVWSQQVYLKGSNTAQSDSFGTSISIDGDTLVVGAQGENSTSTGVNSQPNNSLFGAGAAYVFVREAESWTEQAYLKSSTAGANVFGRSVSISGDTVVVGANGEDAGDTGVNGNEVDKTANASGAAYVFTRTADVWTQQAYVKASNTGAGDQFGQSVAVLGDTLLVGAHGESSNATGVDGNQLDDSVASAGAVYVFTRISDVWSQQSYLKSLNPEASNWFGESVAIAGNLLAVGGGGENSNATGIDGNANNSDADSAGAVYVFSPFEGGPINQAISGFSASPANGVVAGSSELSATASSGLAVTFAGNTPTICTVSGSTVSYVSVGTCSVTADQAGDADYNPAPQVTLNISVGLLEQTISNFSATPATGLVNGSSSLSAMAGASGNPVTFASSTLAVCSVSGSTVNYLTAGTCTVTADQAGNVEYSAAAQVVLDIMVAKIEQNISGLTADPDTGIVGGNSTLNSSASSGLVVIYGSATPAICLASGSTVGYLLAGICTVTANQAGNETYSASPQIMLDIEVARQVIPISPAQPIPALSIWSMLAMILMVLGLGGGLIQHRKSNVH
jgi:hypothetical protein